MLLLDRNITSGNVRGGQTRQNTDGDQGMNGDLGRPAFSGPGRTLVHWRPGPTLLAADAGSGLLGLDLNPVLIRADDGKPLAVDARASLRAGTAA